MKRGQGTPVGAAPKQTYQGVPFAPTPAEQRGADVVILGVPCDDYVTYRPGTRFGPQAIRDAFDGTGAPYAWNVALQIDPFRTLSVVDQGNLCLPGGTDPHRAVRSAVGRIARSGAIPVVLGGDHSIAVPDLAAIADARDGKPFSVVQFDAHADTAPLLGTTITHASAFRAVVENGTIAGRDLVQLGLRGFWPHEAEFAWMRQAGVCWFGADAFDAGVEPVLDRVVELLAEDVYISVDIDVVDPGVAPGTGAPEPGGLTARELLKAVRSLAGRRRLIGLEVCEVSPVHDPSGATSQLAHRVVLEALSSIAARRAAESSDGVGAMAGVGA